MTEENGKVVEKLLQLCYPVDPPSWRDAAEIHPVLAAAIKYQVEAATRLLRKELVTAKFLENEPLRIFVIASRLKLGEEARIAAEWTLAQTLRVSLRLQRCCCPND
ncbi:hypothetical protein OE88DRAFT_1664192 [Heliocybe sulcata]|uniref:BTB domain-containing protein n=1 Tax=Heliocybe sulcata TaxID=5364 RepID=A0A5C3MXD4_9AGAM|nr:hypothetical protein OE88DRAFT_1664192 [Heliocybe sulcata]